jgi:hypothetical protein
MLALVISVAMIILAFPLFIWYDNETSWWIRSPIIVVVFAIIFFIGSGIAYTASVDKIQQLYAGRVQVENALNGARNIPSQVELKNSPDNREIIVDAPNALQSTQNTELYKNVLNTVNEYNSILRNEKYRRDPSLFVKMTEGFYLPNLPDSLVYMRISFK